MKFALSMVLAAVILPFGLAHADTHKKEEGQNISSLAIEFSPGMASLTVAQKKQIRDFAVKAKALKKDAEISVAAWSDQPFPQKGQELSSEQQDLASRRIEKIEQYLEDEVKFEGDVDSYNMAERANWLARAFETEGAEIKSVFSKKDDMAEGVLRSKYAEFKKHGAKQKAVLVMTSKKNKM